MPTEVLQTLQLEVLPKADAELLVAKRSHPGGRPLFLDARRFVRICRWIEQGESASEACRRELAAYRVFRLRVTKYPSYARRLKKAEEVRESFLKEEHMANVRDHAPRNLLASLWWLERRFPGQFALRNVNRPDPERDEPELPSEILARHKQLLLSIAEEDRSRQSSAG
jgi:hypothetical protein